MEDMPNVVEAVLNALGGCAEGGGGYVEVEVVLKAGSVSSRLFRQTARGGLRRRKPKVCYLSIRKAHAIDLLFR